MDAENKTMQPFNPNMDHWEQLEGDICDPQKSGSDVPRGMESSEHQNWNEISQQYVPSPTNECLQSQGGYECLNPGTGRTGS